MLTVVLGDERFEVPAGGIAWLPRGVPHTFANLTADPVHVV
ncbi:MAG: cupin domain-containing protein [Chloroflexota bacterium]|nr:cupin domain-containing protein [Chloroflexota bacterium]